MYENNHAEICRSYEHIAGREVSCHDVNIDTSFPAPHPGVLKRPQAQRRHPALTISLSRHTSSNGPLRKEHLRTTYTRNIIRGFATVLNGIGVSGWWIRLEVTACTESLFSGRKSLGFFPDGWHAIL